MESSFEAGDSGVVGRREAISTSAKAKRVDEKTEDGTAYSVLLPDGHQTGWIGKSRVQDLINEGTINGTSKVYAADSGQWLPLAEVFELAESGDSRSVPDGRVSGTGEDPKRPEVQISPQWDERGGENTQPQIEESELRGKYQELPASELMALIETGALNELATRLANEELASRGISLGESGKKSTNDFSYDI